MSNPQSAPPMSDHRDRRLGLMVFGVLLIVVGCLNALMAVLIVAGPLAMPGPGAAPPTDRMMLPGALTCGALAAMFIWLGAGSVLTRRWAPPLILTIAWLWMVTGGIGVFAAVMLLPSVFTMVEVQSGPMPDGFRTAMMITLIGGLIVVMVIVPGVLVLFYRSRHVLATCLARDSVPRWTDGRPPWLLGLSLSLLMMALSIPPMMLGYNGMAWCFGAVVVGAPGMLINLAYAAVWGWCAWSTLKLDPRGWWAAVLSVTLATASAVVTLARRDPGEIWRAAGLPVDQIQALPGLGATSMIALTLGGWLSIVGYLLYVRKHFRPRGTPAGK